MTTEQFANDLAILFLEFERDVISAKPKYDDNDFTFDKFMHWIKTRY